MCQRKTWNRFAMPPLPRERRLRSSLCICACAYVGLLRCFMSLSVSRPRYFVQLCSHGVHSLGLSTQRDTARQPPAPPPFYFCTLSRRVLFYVVHTLLCLNISCIHVDAFFLSFFLCCRACPSVAHSLTCPRGFLPAGCGLCYRALAEHLSNYFSPYCFIVGFPFGAVFRIWDWVRGVEALDCVLVCWSRAGRCIV
jgi:hypothetical protein